MICPRRGCQNTLTSPDQIVCVGDFTALAAACRGKRPQEKWAAEQIGLLRNLAVYSCPLCLHHHNGNWTDRRHMAVDAATVQALRDDPRVGPLGLQALVEAWRPDNVNRSCWHEGLDQTVAMHLPS